MFKHHFSKQTHIITITVALLIIFVLMAGTPQNQAYADPAQQTQPTNPLAPPDPAPNTPDDTPPTQQQTRALLSVVGGTWLPQGPGPSYSGQVEGITNLEVAGAIHTVAAHPVDADILYTGAANGGIWKTTNATAASPTWVSQTDDKSSLSIGALEFDPTDGLNNTLVAGIGRYSSFSQRGGPRTGILRTIDGGTTWTEINGGGALTGRNISGVAPRGGTIVVSSNIADSFTCGNIGLFRSTDTGATFSQVGPVGVAFDLASDPGNNATLYSGLTYVPLCTGGILANGIYKSINTGTSWTKISSALMDTLIINGTTNNIEIAAQGLNVFVNIIQSGQSVGIFYSADGGTSWTAMDLPLLPSGSLGVISNVMPGAPIVITTSAAHGLISSDEVQITNVTGTTLANGIHTITYIDATNFSLNGSSDGTAWGGDGNWQKVVGMNPKQKPGGQGGIHASIRIDPNNPTIVYIGGDRQDLPFPNYINAVNYTGSLFRGNPGIAATGGSPSPQWDHLTHYNAIATIPGGGTVNSSAPHADSREMVFDANGDLIEVDDGGIYRRTYPQNNTGDWFSINGDIQVTEIHNVAYDNLSNVIMSGNQDTGTTYQTTVGHSNWNSISTADGGDVAVDNIVLAGSDQSVRYSSFQNLGWFRRTVWNANGILFSTSFPTLIVNGGGNALVQQFTTPVVTNGIAGNRLLIGGGNSLYESIDGGATITEIGVGVVVNSGSGGHMMAYGAAGNPDVLYVATGSSVAVRTLPHPAAITTYAIPGATTILGVAIDPVNANIAYAIDSSNVYRTINAGVNWIPITGTLTDTNLRSIEAAPGELFVGGGLGVYTADMTTPTSWSLYGSGLPHTPVWDLDYDDTDKVLVAGTLGRGAWLMPVTPVAAPLVYAAPDVATCGSNAPCLSVTNPVQNALTAMANNGTVRVLGANNIAAPLTSGNGGSHTVIVDSVPNGALNSTLNFTGNGFDVGPGNITIRGLNLSGATTVFNQTGGVLTAYANNITGWTTAHSTSGGTAVLGNNWWDTTSAVYNAADPGLPAGDWDKRLGADIGSWNIGTDTVALGSADLTVSGGTGTAVILSFGRASANAPFGNGIAPHVDNMCSDYYDFFVRNATGTWNVTTPVDNTVNCNNNTLLTDRLFRISNVANCAPTDTQCWDSSGLALSHLGQNVVASGLTPAQLSGTHFVAGSDQGLDPTAVQLDAIKSSSVTSWLPLLSLAALLITGSTLWIWGKR